MLFQGLVELMWQCSSTDSLPLRGQPATALKLAILTSNRERERSPEQEAALNQLAEMGFTDRNGNKKLLEQLRNDVAKVVDLLSQEASTDQRRDNEGGRGRSGESGGGSDRGSCLEEGRCYVDTSRNLGSGSFADVVGGTYRFPEQHVDTSTQVAFKIFLGDRNLASLVSEKNKEEVELGMKSITRTL